MSGGSNDVEAGAGLRVTQRSAHEEEATTSSCRIWIMLAVCGVIASVALAQTTTGRAEFLNEVKALRAALQA